MLNLKTSFCCMLHVCVTTHAKIIVNNMMGVTQGVARARLRQLRLDIRPAKVIVLIDMTTASQM